MTKRNNPVRNNPIISQVMVDHLTEAPQTYESLAQISGLSKVGVATWVKSMRAAGRIYRSGWVEDKRGRQFTPTYMWGDKPDVPRAGRIDNSAARMRVYRARKKIKQELGL